MYSPEKHILQIVPSMDIYIVSLTPHSLKALFSGIRESMIGTTEEQITAQ